MKKNIFFKYILVACSVLALFSACRKQSMGDLSNEDPNAGKSYIGIPTGLETSTFFDPFTNVKAVTVFTVKKDAANNADLKKPQNIVLSALPDAIVKYNEANDKEVELLPASFYTVSAGVDQASNGDLTVPFASGDFSKNFVINLDGSKLDLSKTYALAYQITNADGLTIHEASKDTILAFFSVKNKWDGVYTATGTMSDVQSAANVHVNEGLGDKAPMQYELRTISATECVVYDNYQIHGVALPFWNGTGVSYWGSFGLVVKFDPATDKIASVTNYYGQPSANTRSAFLDASGVNAYDAGTKTIQIKYYMTQPSVVTTPPNIRVRWEETWKYLKSR